MKLVKLDDVLKLIDGSMADLESNYENSKLQEEIKRLPTVDAVPVVRCKDCKHKPTDTGVDHDIEFPDEVCPCQCVGDNWYSWMPRDNCFCSWGERKEDGNNQNQSI